MVQLVSIIVLGCGVNPTFHKSLVSKFLGLPTYYQLVQGTHVLVWISPVTTHEGDVLESHNG